MLTSLIVGARNSIHRSLVYQPLPYRNNCHNQTGASFPNLLFFIAAILAPWYFTILKDVISSLRGMKYKIVKV